MVGPLRVVVPTFATRNRGLAKMGHGAPSFSSDADAILLHHLSAERDELIGWGGAGEEADVWTFVKGGFFPGAAEYEDRDVGHAGGELCDECRASKARAIEADHHESEPLGEARILHEDESFGGIRGPLNVGEMAPQDRLTHVGL